MSSESNSPERTDTIAAVMYPPDAYAPNTNSGPEENTSEKSTEFPGKETAPPSTVDPSPSEEVEGETSTPLCPSSTSKSAIPLHSSPSAQLAFSPLNSKPTLPNAIIPAPTALSPPNFNRLLLMSLYIKLATNPTGGNVANFTAHPKPTTPKSVSIAGKPCNGSPPSRFKTCKVSIASSNVTPWCLEAS